MSRNYVQRMLAACERELLTVAPSLTQDFIEVYSLLGLVLGVEVGLSDVHEAYGIVRNRTNPEHRYIVPFEDLPDEIKELDRRYVDAIRKAVASLGWEPAPQDS